MEPSSEVTTELRLPESPRLPMEFLSRSWSASSQQLSKALAPSKSPSTELLIRTDSDDSKINSSNAASDSSSFASSNASHLVLQRIMSYTEISPMTSARPSHSGPLLSPNSSSGDLENDVVKVFKESSYNGGGSHQREINPVARGGTVTVTVGRWLKDRKEKKKEESRVNNAELHAIVSVAGVAAAVAAMAAGNVGVVKDEKKGKLDLAVASAATLVAAHCVEVAEALGVERDQLASVVGSAVNVKCSDDVLTLTAAAATALRGAATLKARVMKDTQNQNAAFNHMSRESEKQGDHSNLPVDNVGSEELASRGCRLNSTSVLEYIGTGRELLKRTRNGDLHRKNVSVYIHRSGEVMLKMTSKYVGGTITNKKKNVVIEVCKNMPSWPGRRHLLEDGAHPRYFGLKTAVRGIVEFECRDQEEHDLWTEGVSKLLALVASR